jgi:hypothetical protein
VDAWRRRQGAAGDAVRYRVEIFWKGSWCVVQAHCTHAVAEVWRGYCEAHGDEARIEEEG